MKMVPATQYAQCVVMPIQAQAHQAIRLFTMQQHTAACCLSCLAQYTHTVHTFAVCLRDCFQATEHYTMAYYLLHMELTWDLTGSPKSHSWPCSQYSMGAAIPTSSSATCTAHRHCSAWTATFHATEAAWSSAMTACTACIGINSLQEWCSTV